MIVVTKIDLVTGARLEKTLQEVEKHLRKLQPKKSIFRVASEDDVINVVGNNQNVPLVCVSSATGSGLQLLYRLVFLLPPGMSPKQRQMLDVREILRHYVYC